MIGAEEGDIILYLMKLTDLPVDPQREWSGKVRQVNPSTDRTSAYYRVVSLEPGYEGLLETVYLFQVVGIIKTEREQEA